MSLARNLTGYGDLAGNTARTLAPEIRAPQPTTRPTARPRRAARRLVFSVAVLWIAVMGLAVVSIWRNSLVQREMSAITRGQDELAGLNLQNRELEDQLVKATSAGAVQEWALAHGMKQTVAFKPLAKDPAAVAARPAEPAEAQVPAESTDGFWSTVKSSLARMFGGSQVAAGHR